MSYILDALRKVERERQRTRLPLLEELLDARATPRARLWPWLLVGALLVNAVVVAVLLVPRGWLGKSQRLSSPDVTAARQTAVTTAALVPEERPGPPAPPVAPGTPDPQPAQKEGVPAQGPVKGSATKTPVRAVTPVRSMPAREAAPAAAPPGEEAGHESGHFGREQLLKAVTALKLTMLLHSESAAERLALINGRKYLEGQKIDGTVLVEAITPKGVMLSYEGERYLLTP
jgi:general secretion pathway protein B